MITLFECPFPMFYLFQRFVTSHTMRPWDVWYKAQMLSKWSLKVSMEISSFLSSLGIELKANGPRTRKLSCFNLFLAIGTSTVTPRWWSESVLITIPGFGTIFFNIFQTKVNRYLSNLLWILWSFKAFNPSGYERLLTSGMSLVK